MIRCLGDGEGTPEGDQATLVSPVLFGSVQDVHILAKQVETKLINLLRSQRNSKAKCQGLESCNFNFLKLLRWAIIMSFENIPS